ncbi:MAG TPA: threonylcarbamoyl-AMP synthase [Methanosarcinales archaeon]|nr:threonylcarbamoyl-AMP synthase [Methanosarcinales archaeon]
MIVKEIVKAANIIKKGGIVAYPTETVYGLGALLEEDTIKKVFNLKKRPLSNPISLAVSSIDMIEKVAYVDSKSKNFIDQFLPGPVTILLKKKTSLPNILTASSEIVGIRYPNHEIALKLIELTGPITSTSANLSGEQPPTSMEEINLPCYILYGVCEYKIPSTIVDLVNWKILRKGAGYEEIKKGILSNIYHRPTIR